MTPVESGLLALTPLRVFSVFSKLVQIYLPQCLFNVLPVSVLGIVIKAFPLIFYILSQAFTYLNLYGFIIRLVKAPK